MKHPHAEVIKAWADGEIVQYLSEKKNEWIDLVYTGDAAPAFFASVKYRIKPKEVVDYTIVLPSGVPGARFMNTAEGALDLYSEHILSIQGIFKRTTVDGKVVSFEFVPK